MWYFSPGNLPILSKQSPYSFRISPLVSLLCAAAYLAGLSGVEFDCMSSMFTAIIPSCCAWAHPITEGLPGTCTILNFVSIDLSLNVTFRSVTPMFLMDPGPYPSSRLSSFLMSTGNGMSYKSSVFTTQISAPVSTFSSI